MFFIPDCHCGTLYSKSAIPCPRPSTVLWRPAARQLQSDGSLRLLTPRSSAWNMSSTWWFSSRIWFYNADGACSQSSGRVRPHSKSEQVSHCCTCFAEADHMQTVHNYCAPPVFWACEDNPARLLFFFLVMLETFTPPSRGVQLQLPDLR